MYVTATVVKTCHSIFKSFGIVSTITTKFTVDKESVFDNMPFFILLGFICGYLGSLWIYLFSIFNQYRAQVPIAIVKQRWFQVIFLCFLISLIMFWVPTSFKGNKGLLSDMWSQDDLYIKPNKTYPSMTTLI